MTWVKLDDCFPVNPKVVDLDADAFRLYVEALCYCGQNNTDGVVTAGALRRLWCPEKAAELVRVVLWLEHPDGYEVKDFLKYNPSRAQVEAEREKARTRKERWRERRSEQRGERATEPPPRPDPSRPEGSRDGESVATPITEPIVSAPVPDALRQQNLAQVRQLRTQEAVG